MSWIDYYNLLRKYQGKISLANPQEMREAARANPNTPSEAYKIAKQKYQEKYATARA